LTQHASLKEARWAEFDLDQQILMIGNEMNRGIRLARAGQYESLQRGYERVMRLADLTARFALRASFRREILRWRGLVAELFLLEEADPERHEAVFRVLLQLRPVPSRQIPLLLGPPKRRDHHPPDPI
jgi:hypothetical protein